MLGSDFADWAPRPRAVAERPAGWIACSGPPAVVVYARRAMHEPTGQVTRLLREVEAGSDEAKARLLDVLHDELVRIAVV